MVVGISRTAMADRPAGCPTDATLRDFLGYRLKRAYMAVQADLTSALAEHDLRLSTFSVLSVIAENPGLTQTEVGAVLAIERSNLVGLLDDLEKRGLVIRGRVPSDRRSYALRITLEGQDLRERAARTIASHEAVMFAGLPAEDRARLFDTLTTIENHRAPRRGGSGEAGQKGR